MLMPPSLQEWLPEGHLAHFVVETVALLPLGGFRVNTRGTGHAQFPPSMMLALLVYNYAVGRMSSRQTEKATYEDVASRSICGGDAHPDHDTVSHGRAGGMIEELKGEVRELVALAEKADRVAVPETLKVPEETARREARRERGEAVRGPEPQPPRAEPDAKDPYNFTDPESRIMKAVMGFRKFLLRGLRKVNLEWTLVRLAYNFRRLATLLAAKQGPDCAPMAPATA